MVSSLTNFFLFQPPKPPTYDKDTITEIIYVPTP